MRVFRLKSFRQRAASEAKRSDGLTVEQHRPCSSSSIAASQAATRLRPDDAAAGKNGSDAGQLPRTHRDAEPFGGVNALLAPMALSTRVPGAAQHEAKRNDATQTRDPGYFLFRGEQPGSRISGAPP